MKKFQLFNFLSLRTYRRTFVTYIIITLVLITGVTSVLLFSTLRTGLDSFSATADSTFTNIEMKYENVINSIDRLFYRIYSNPSLEEQFVRERYYGVCDNLVYSYDAISDTWSAVGRQ